MPKHLYSWRRILSSPAVDEMDSDPSAYWNAVYRYPYCVSALNISIWRYFDYQKVKRNLWYSCFLSVCVCAHAIYKSGRDAFKYSDYLSKQLKEMQLARRGAEWNATATQEQQQLSRWCLNDSVWRKTMEDLKWLNSKKSNQMLKWHTHCDIYFSVKYAFTVSQLNEKHGKRTII